MSTLTEQFSAVRKSQVESQINFFQDYAAKAIESTRKIIALNLNVSRASMEKSSAAIADLLVTQDPRDLFALTKRTQENFDGFLAYQRELMAIATGAGAALGEAALKVAPALKAPALELVKPAEPVLPVADAAAPLTAPLAAPVVAPEVAPPVVLEVAEPAPAALASLPASAAAPTPIAKAVSKVVPKPVAAPPAAAPLAPAAEKVQVSGLKPVEATPAPAAPTGKPALAQQQLDLAANKGKKKK
jgi:phasin family protein